MLGEIYTDGHRVVRRVTEKKRTAGGAHAFYEVATAVGPDGERTDETIIGTLDFQHDTIPAVGVQGWTNESVVTVVIDRLEGFQANAFACEANAIALEHFRAGVAALEARTADRKARGVEGEHKA